MMMLKPLLGLRSAINTVARGLNPFGAQASLQAAFHPAYVTLHRDAALLRWAILACGAFGGDGGENERRPEKPVDISAGRERRRARFHLLPPYDRRAFGARNGAAARKRSPTLWREGRRRAGRGGGGRHVGAGAGS